ncbi:flagellar biosynthesis protein FliQ [Wenzhouxiangella sp. AB-CW3]|uniref:flagellar biosynthesis protein FliQ n=1 Tax=Wenzhouxiangella sp. AB-CW3 TaxID=2771012 RepID=UPI00168AA1E4|nr:flagellar biosynthesis protein FliQ [Wenzhouxiangella sp. AB-CW3]QOC21194.1 flagellar biosynthesis protein FliQ [Wenzhouxiangella sp. AB-CW3]
MTPEMVIDIGRQALWVVALLLSPMLLSALAVGLMIGMFQAATQINEMTLSFIPKLAVLILALVLAGPWMLELIVSFTHDMISNAPNLVDPN